tara:strand:- start:1006 stop:1245 length:240 start_codon:yes stop_codon:yes gene_type:complete
MHVWNLSGWSLIDRNQSAFWIALLTKVWTLRVLIDLAIHTPYLNLDICLDPIYASGGTTTRDALWMEVPVVTITGETQF